MYDARGRRLRDLRVSVTDRCNFRCRYCMPRESFGRGHRFATQHDLLAFEEITEIVSAFLVLGIEKVRLTGGEPLLRNGIVDLVTDLRRAAPDVDLAMTTNGVLLSQYAVDLRAAGLDRLTISLDSLDELTFRAMTDSRFHVADVLAGIEAADRAGFAGIKINVVVQFGVNDHLIAELAQYFRGTGHIIRFIEYMDVGTTNRWDRGQVVDANWIVARINRETPLEAIAPSYDGEVSRRYRYHDGSGEIGVIASVTEPFCGSCTRARLSATGQLHTCLFSTAGLDLRSIVRGQRSDDDLQQAIRTRWAQRSDRYSELRSAGGDNSPHKKIEMSFIGG
nr:GTP 3',8-cyclase MoaA [Mycobacterium sp. MS1601]